MYLIPCLSSNRSSDPPPCRISIAHECPTTWTPTIIVLTDQEVVDDILGMFSKPVISSLFRFRTPHTTYSTRISFLLHPLDRPPPPLYIPGLGRLNLFSFARARNNKRPGGRISCFGASVGQEQWDGRERFFVHLRVIMLTYKSFPRALPRYRCVCIGRFFNSKTHLDSLANLKLRAKARTAAPTTPFAYLLPIQPIQWAFELWKY